ncbi:MAG: hypothetical protein RR573_03860 [Oscillospiraceae bacterium]
MTDCEKTSELLDKKYELFLEYETQSRLALQADDDDIDNYITKRGDIANIIDEQSAEINNICTKPCNAKLAQAAFCTGDYSEIAQEYIYIYDKASKIYAVLSRIDELNIELTAMLESKKEHLRKRLAATKNTPKIARYLNTLKGTPSSGDYMGDKTT